MSYNGALFLGVLAIKYIWGWVSLQVQQTTIENQFVLWKSGLTLEKLVLEIEKEAWYIWCKAVSIKIDVDMKTLIGNIWFFFQSNITTDVFPIPDNLCFGCSKCFIKETKYKWNVTKRKR